MRDRARRKAEAPLINRRPRRARVVAAVDISPGSGTEWEPRKICLFGFSLSLSLSLCSAQADAGKTPAVEMEYSQ
jgi:hypothetical protein